MARELHRHCVWFLRAPKWNLPAATRLVHGLQLKDLARQPEVLGILRWHCDSKNPQLPGNGLRLAAARRHDLDGQCGPDPAKTRQVVATHQDANRLEVLQASTIQRIIQDNLSAMSIATELVEHSGRAKREEIAVFRDAEVNVTMPSQIHHLSIGFTRCMDIPDQIGRAHV